MNYPSHRSLAKLLLFSVVSLALPAVLSAALFAADDDTGVYVDPANVPIDYQFQGEYEGKAGEEAIRYGAQVIALGNDQFRLVGYAGGLPGDGWDPATEKIEIEGRREGEQVVFKNDLFSVAIDGNGTMTPRSVADGVQRGELKRIERTSPTLGQAAPDSALVLFSGDSADAFQNGKIVQDDLLLADCESKQAFGDHSLHIEFRTPFKPAGRGQGRGNSGVYIQGRYELQVLDSFGLSGENNECGGIYQIAKPAVNMCFPPLQWQTYDIDFTAAKYDDAGEKTANARTTIKHNGVVIHENLELPHGTPGKYPEGTEPSPLYLQGHGNPVVFKNIWVVQK